jgi:hypothetical protein
MSCNICHTPILVDQAFLNPNDLARVTQIDHLDPIVGKVCPTKLHQPYFRNVVHLDRRYEGLMLGDLVHSGRGRFMGRQWPIRETPLVIVQEEMSRRGDTVSCVIPFCILIQYHVAHEGCIKILCSEIGVPFNFKHRETLIALLERHEFLGTTTYGGYDRIDYFEGGLEERWFSQPSGRFGANLFEWDFANGEQDWTMKRYLSN